MDAATQNKNERINLRLKSSAKNLIERAASFEGKPVSHYILTSALEQAEKTFQEHEIMTLNAKNSRIFFEALAAPVRFNRKLAAALEEHDLRVVSKWQIFKIWLLSRLTAHMTGRAVGLVSKRWIATLKSKPSRTIKRRISRVFDRD